jgi:hypothetical protein
MDLFFARLMNPNALLAVVGRVQAEMVLRAVRIVITRDAPIDADAVFAVEAFEAVRLQTAPGRRPNASRALAREGDALAPAGTIACRKAGAAHRMCALLDRLTLLGRTSGLDAGAARHAIDVGVAEVIDRTPAAKRAALADLPGGATAPAEARYAPAACVAACPSGASRTPFAADYARITAGFGTAAEYTSARR